MASTIGIVGSGVSGLHLGLFLRAHDVPVTIYADKEPDEIRAGRLLNTVAHHHHTLERERALGVHHWDVGEYGYCCHHHCVGGELRFRGDFDHPSSSIDYRVYLPRLMEDFQERGGELVIMPSVAAVEDIERLSAAPRPDGRRRRAAQHGGAVRAAATTSRPTTVRSDGSRPGSTAGSRTPSPRASACTSPRATASCSSCRSTPTTASPRRCCSRTSPAARSSRSPMSATTTIPPPSTASCSDACATHYPMAAERVDADGLRPVVGPRPPAGRADADRARGLRAPEQRALRAGHGRRAHRRRPDDGPGRELGVVLGLDDRGGDRRRPRLRRALLRSASRAVARASCTASRTGPT